MSDQEFAKKTAEEWDLDLFLDAYREGTGERLQVVEVRERPDFICRRPDGSLVGIELTRARRDPQSLTADLIYGNQFADPRLTWDFICRSIEWKEKKRTSHDWGCADSTILVIPVDCPLDDLAYYLNDWPPDDFDGHGFLAIFIADHSELDAYDAVELFALHHPESELRGHWERDRGKPYG